MQQNVFHSTRRRILSLNKTGFTSCSSRTTPSPVFSIDGLGAFLEASIAAAPGEGDESPAISLWFADLVHGPTREDSEEPQAQDKILKLASKDTRHPPTGIAETRFLLILELEDTLRNQQANSFAAKRGSTDDSPLDIDKIQGFRSIRNEITVLQVVTQGNVHRQYIILHPRSKWVQDTGRWTKTS